MLAYAWLQTPPWQSFYLLFILSGCNRQQISRSPLLQLPSVSVHKHRASPSAVHSSRTATPEVKPAWHQSLLQDTPSLRNKRPLLPYTKQNASLLLPNHTELKAAFSSTFPSRLSPFLTYPRDLSRKSSTHGATKAQNVLPRGADGTGGMRRGYGLLSPI